MQIFTRLVASPISSLPPLAGSSGSLRACTAPRPSWPSCGPVSRTGRACEPPGQPPSVQGQWNQRKTRHLYCTRPPPGSVRPPCPRWGETRTRWPFRPGPGGRSGRRGQPGGRSWPRGSGESPWAAAHPAYNPATGRAGRTGRLGWWCVCAEHGGALRLIPALVPPAVHCRVDVGGYRRVIRDASGVACFGVRPQPLSESNRGAHDSGSHVHCPYPGTAAS